MSKIARKKFRPDYRLEIHHKELRERRLDIQIKKYISKRNQVFRLISSGQKSYFHDEPVRDNEYLRTAVLTALKKDAGQTRRSKGGRKPGMGAKSIIRRCIQLGFANEIPRDDKNRIEDNLHPGKYLGVVKIKFNERKIRDILRDFYN